MRQRLRQLDWTYLLAAVALAVIGLVAIAHSGVGASEQATRQLIWLGLGLVTLTIFLVIDYRTWGELAWVLFGLSTAALVIVLVAGTKVHGSKSWLSLGPLRGQPSEFVKLCVVLAVARVLAGSRGETARPFRLLLAAMLVGLPFLLILLQPDLGTACVFGGLLAALLVTVGMPRAIWAALLVVGALGGSFVWTSMLKPYQKQRIMYFVAPPTEGGAIGYQVEQSRIAIGSGGLWGKGFAAGTQSQLEFLPENETDFVFAVVAEAWGFVGSALVLGLYAYLIYNGLRIALQARDAFGSYLVMGIMFVLTIHVVVNLGMVMGVLPTIGIPLPLMSYGGSSIVTTFAGLGLVLNVAMRRAENR